MKRIYKGYVIEQEDTMFKAYNRENSESPVLCASTFERIIATIDQEADITCLCCGHTLPNWMYDIIHSVGAFGLCCACDTDSAIKQFTVVTEPLMIDRRNFHDANPVFA